MTLAEVAHELGITRARVGQIEAKALAKLRAALEAEGVADDVVAALRDLDRTRGASNDELAF